MVSPSPPSKKAIRGYPFNIHAYDAWVFLYEKTGGMFLPVIVYECWIFSFSGSPKSGLRERYC